MPRIKISWIQIATGVFFFTLVLTGVLVALEEKPLFDQAKGLFKPLPKEMGTAEFPVTAERVSLGRALFF